MGFDGSHMPPDAEQKRMMARQAATAFPKAGPGEPVIALSHHPEFFRRLPLTQGAQLTLSSHTHGGQVKAFGRPLINAYDYMSGRYEANNTHLDVSAGFGPLAAFKDGRAPRGRDRHPAQSETLTRTQRLQQDGRIFETV